MLITLKILKRSSFKNVSFVILLLKICFVFGQQKVIVIDPGHGGKDSGAIGENGIVEKEIVLNVANQILVLNKMLFNNKIDIYLTRYGDTLISLKDRGQLAKSLMADVFVSLHCNHSVNPDARGIEVYAYNKENAYSRKSIWLGYQLQKEMNEELDLKTRGVKFANFQVLREAAGCYASVLVEMGFVTNGDEANYYLKPKKIRAMALAILMGLDDYINYERIWD